MQNTDQVKGLHFPRGGVGARQVAAVVDAASGRLVTDDAGIAWAFQEHAAKIAGAGQGDFPPGDWQADVQTMKDAGGYFFSLNRFVFVARKPLA
jgi:hypothetical protein